MLRILIVSVVVVATAASAELGDLDKAEAGAAAVQAETQSALEEFDGLGITKTLPDFEESVRRSARVPAGVFPKLSDELTDPETLSTIGELMDNAQTLAATLGMPTAGDEGVSVYLFASFSMPNASLRSLIEQGELAGIPIVLRGLVNNSIEDTMRQVHSLYEEGEQQESGAVIDPTLFERFGITQVPSVVVAAHSADVCTPQDCPTPEHVKIAGDVPLRYSLDRIALAKPAFRQDLRVMMKRLEPERSW